MNRVLIVSHSTDLEGSVDLLERYLLKHFNFGIKKIAHPLNVYSGKTTKIFDNKILSKTIKRFGNGILNLPLDALITFYCVLKSKPTIYIGANNFDVVPGIILKRFFRYKVIFFASDYSEDRFSSSLLNNIYQHVEKFANRYSDLVISNTYRAEKMRMERGLEKGRSLVLPNGIQPMNFSFTEKRIDKSKFIFVGNVTPGHGVLDFLKTYKGKISEIVIIGDGEELGQVKDYCKNMKIKLVCHGVLQRDEVLSILEKYNGLGLAFYNLAEKHIHYGSSLKLIEYICTGTPPVTTGVLEIAEFIKNEEMGIVTDSRQDVEKLVDEFNVKGYSSKARKFYDEFNTDSIYKKIKLFNV